MQEAQQFLDMCDGDINKACNLIGEMFGAGGGGGGAGFADDFYHDADDQSGPIAMQDDYTFI